MLDRGSVLVAHHGFWPDDSPQVLEVGARRPVHACAMGKVLLAYDAAATALALGRPLPAYTPRTVCTPGALTAALAQVRRAGWAVEAEERAMGQAGLACPVRDRGGLTVAAVGVTGSLERLCDASRAPRPALLSLCCHGHRARARRRRLTVGPSAPEGPRVQHYVAAIDQGTTSTRCILFDQLGRLVSVSQAEHAQHFPRPG